MKLKIRTHVKAGAEYPTEEQKKVIAYLSNIH